MEDSYFTLQHPGEGLYKEKGSKFIAMAWPVTTEEEVEQFLAEARKKYYDSRHVCYAWRLGREGKRFRANDDGEPSHSAGDPILNEMKSQELSDVLVAVVRYFGGTKLGVGGLIRAYGTAAKEALEDGEREEVVLREEVEIRFPYEKTSDVNRVLHPFRIEASTKEYEMDCRFIYRIRLSRVERIKQVLREIGVLVEKEED
ncbi:UNVERIFIED_CONTAM: hypothetical protein GTU68_057458 [Idotea baltica]|nr:hypothetical protein [Idotea baltica]